MRAVIYALALLTFLVFIPDVDAQQKGKKAPPADPDITAVAAGFTVVSVILVIVGIVAGLLALAMYFVPVFVALYRGHPNAIAISAVCLLFGWTFLGWGIALIWSLTNFRKDSPQQIVIHHSGGGQRPHGGGDPFDFN